MNPHTPNGPKRRGGISLRMMIALLALLSVVGAVVVGGYSILHVRSLLQEEAIRRTGEMAVAARGLVASFEERERSGDMTRETAQAAARNQMHAMRHSGGEYVFIYAYDGTMLSYAPKPSREGENLLSAKDPDGKPFIAELIAAAQAGGGHVFYQFPRPGSDRPVPKVSSVVPFEPWGWMIGTGI